MCAIHPCPSQKEAKAFLFRCRAILCPSSKPNVPGSPEDTPSNLLKSQNSIHGKLDTNVGVHSRRKPTFSDTPPSHDTFTTPASTNTQSAPLPLRPVETRAGSERGLKPCCSFLGTRRDISLCLRTEPFYSTTRSSNLIGLSKKKLHDRFLRDPLVDLCCWELGFGRSSLAVAHVTLTPGPAPAPPLFANGKGKTCTIDDDLT